MAGKRGPYLYLLVAVRDERIVYRGLQVRARPASDYVKLVTADDGDLHAPRAFFFNTISPGWIPVERHEADAQEDKDAYHALIPLGRWGVPDDIGAAADFLASQEAGFITGQTLVVNGGLTVS